MCPAPTEAGLARIIHCGARATHSYGTAAASQVAGRARPFTVLHTGSCNGRHCTGTGSWQELNC